MSRERERERREGVSERAVDVGRGSMRKKKTRENGFYRCLERER